MRIYARPIRVGVCAKCEYRSLLRDRAIPYKDLYPFRFVLKLARFQKYVQNSTRLITVHEKVYYFQNKTLVKVTLKLSRKSQVEIRIERKFSFDAIIMTDFLRKQLLYCLESLKPLVFQVLQYQRFLKDRVCTEKYMNLKKTK